MIDRTFYEEVDKTLLKGEELIKRVDERIKKSDELLKKIREEKANGKQV